MGRPKRKNGGCTCSRRPSDVIRKLLRYCSPLMAMLSELDVPVLVPQITVLPQSTLKASVVLVPQMTVVPQITVDPFTKTLVPQITVLLQGPVVPQITVVP